LKSPRGNRAGTEPIVAAGGIVRGAGDNRGKIVIVHRRRYGGEIGLPKGKSEPGETPAATALREVEEETGLIAKVREFAGSTHYEVGRTPKVVHYYVMDYDRLSATKRDSKEVERSEWVTPIEAVEKLTHNEDRELIAVVFGLPKGHSK